MTNKHAENSGGCGSDEEEDAVKEGEKKRLSIWLLVLALEPNVRCAYMIKKKVEQLTTNSAKAILTRPMAVDKRWSNRIGSLA